MMIGALVLGLAVSTSSAFAGPTWTFGPEEQGLLKLDYKGQFQLTYRDEGAGPDGGEEAMEFNFRRNRLALMGAWGPSFSLYVQTEFNEDNNIGPLSVSDGDNSDFQILDAVLRFKHSDSLNIWVGKFKYNLTRENLESCEDPLTLDRSLLIRAPYVTTRDKGVAVWGNFLEGMLQYRIDAMNGRNDSSSAPESNFRYSARGHVSLLDKENGYGYKGTYLGKKKVLTVGAAYQMEKDIAFAAPGQAVDYEAWTVDGFFEYPVAGVGTVTASAAYVDYDLDDAYQGAAPEAGTIGLNGEKNGWYGKVGYMLPTMPLQFFARYENWSFANLDGVFDQEIDWMGAGFNYYFRGQDLKLTAEYSTVDFDKSSPSFQDFDTVVVQLQVIF
ncbi:MAG: porin [Desulfuromonadales bacterium]|nr:porin [Desulfuromonadales bacterium]